MDRRTLFILILGLVPVLGIVIFVFYVFVRQPQVPNQNVIATSLQIKKVLDEEVISPVSGFDNNSIWYFNSEDRLFKVNVDGSNLSEFPLPSIPEGNLRKVLWPSNGSDFISISGGIKIVKSYFDSTNKIFVNFADNVQYVEWLPDGRRVVYIWKSADGKNQLVMANADGSGYTPISDVFWSDLVLKPGTDGKTVLMYRSNITGDSNKIYSINLETREIKTVVDSGKNIAAEWITENSFLVQRDFSIYLYDLTNNQSTDLKINANLDQVEADSTKRTLYAAIPVPDGADRIIKVNLDDGSSETYFESQTDIQVESLMLVGNTVYFVDENDHKLYIIRK